MITIQENNSRHPNPSSHLFKSVYYSDSFDPVYNFSIEAYLLSICQPNEVILFLWANHPCIVLGKHQNPYKECQLDLIKEAHISLVRRLSGGGTVYQDLGNLNFSFIAHKPIYNIKKHFSVVLDALTLFNIHGYKSSRNDLLLNGRKFSGNAFIHRKSLACHHGTLLIHTNLEQLTRYLESSTQIIVGKSVPSVPSKVINLREVQPTLTLEEVVHALTKKFDQHYTGSLIHQPLPATHLLKSYINQFQSWAWTFGATPNYTLSHKQVYTWGTVSMDLTIKQDKIKTCSINTHPTNLPGFDALAIAMKNQPLRLTSLQLHLESALKKTHHEKDLSNFILSMVGLYSL